ncbi:GNAT family protein [Candidatus Amarolinea dominans]|uniref:GNAT family N-acetyltransferase n=1 Tax=Candidatus Amarolinea dominans TaxID=3140696 RepID=UPI003136B354|nr:GNAT family N-acetyltransferase [Anaerolineae bacterium]
MTKIVKDNNFPTLETERLILRQMTLEDTDFVFQHFSDSAVSRYLMDEPPVTEYAQAQEIIQFYLEPEEGTHNRWLMVRKSDHRSIGTCGFHKWDKRYFRAEIGYDLSPSFWGQGYMIEALRAVIASGVEHMRLNRIDALVYIENDRSIQLLRRLGFKQEGVLRDYFCLDGKFYDHYLFALLQREWKS